MQPAQNQSTPWPWIIAGIVLATAAVCLVSLLIGAAVAFAFTKPRLQQAELRAMRAEAELAELRAQGRPAAMPRVTRPDARPEGFAQSSFEEVTRPTASVQKGDIINVNFAGKGKKGQAAIGRGPDDFWNHYNFPFAMRATLYDLQTSDGRNTGAILQTHTLPGTWGWECPDPMWGTFSYSETEEGHLRFPNLPAGTYTLYIFGHSAGGPNPEKDWENFTRTRVEASGKDYGVLATEPSPDFLSLDWKQGIHYVVFEDVEVREGGMIHITLLRGGKGAKPSINGLQLQRIR
jgi:hypothetical protein